MHLHLGQSEKANGGAVRIGIQTIRPQDGIFERDREGRSIAAQARALRSTYVLDFKQRVQTPMGIALECFRPMLEALTAGQRGMRRDFRVDLGRPLELLDWQVLHGCLPETAEG